eukprot:10414322-Alexandrium_andersonii.AAC.1
MCIRDRSRLAVSRPRASFFESPLLCSWPSRRPCRTRGVASGVRSLNCAAPEAVSELVSEAHKAA